jgi:hypothetical protein
VSTSHTTPLPSDATLLDPVAMSLELGTVATKVVVEYGNPGGSGLRPEVTAEDDALREQLAGATGPHRVKRVTVQLAVDADAQAYADWMLAALAPAWSMPAATVALSMTDDPTIDDLAGLQLGEWATLPTLLPGSPSASYTARVLGVAEYLSASDWALNFHLAPAEGISA